MQAEKKIYKNFMTNAAFEKAYQAIDQSFKSAISDYLMRLEEINVIVTEAGLDYRVDGDY